MNEIVARAQLKTLLARYEKMSGVAEYVILERGEFAPEAFETHRRAAIRTLEVLGERRDQVYERLYGRHDDRGKREKLTREAFGYVNILPEHLIACEISPAEFLGRTFPYLCAQSSALETVKERETAYAGLCREIASLPVVPIDVAYTNGYAYAFATGPHGPHATEEEISALFFEVAEELFCGFQCPLSICQWSPYCSNYFDAGHEWWGSFFWTVLLKGTDYIVGIVASSTD